MLLKLVTSLFISMSMLIKGVKYVVYDLNGLDVHRVDLIFGNGLEFIE